MTDNVFRMARDCACGRPATTLMVYGEPDAAPWGANSWCDTHAAYSQVHRVAETRRASDA